MTKNTHEMNILIIRYGSLGDIFVAFPAFEAIRRNFPKAHITLMTASHYAVFLKATPWFDAIFEDNQLSLFKIKENFQFIKKLRKNFYDWVFDLQRSQRVRLYYKFMNFKYWNGSYGTHAYVPPKEIIFSNFVLNEHQLNAANIQNFYEPDLSWIYNDLNINIHDYKDKNYVLIFPSTSQLGSNRRWKSEYFSQTLEFLIHNKFLPILIGSAEESYIAENILNLVPSHLRGGIENFFGKTTLGDMINLGKYAQCAIGNDTGPAHVISYGLSLASRKNQELSPPIFIFYSHTSHPAQASPIAKNIIAFQDGDLSNITPHILFQEIENSMKNHFNISITFPDQSVHLYPKNTLAQTLLQNLPASSVRKTVGFEILEKKILIDLQTPLKDDATVAPIFIDSPQYLEILRHSCAHLMAHAVRLLYPQAQMVIGPTIEHGFYYDFSFEHPFSTDDFPAIEKKMKELIQQEHPLVRETWTREKALEYFKKTNQVYKVLLIESFSPDEIITFYRQDDFIDLCRGPHVSNTKFMSDGFKLTKVSGAYWKGDSKNQMLQRIYGTAWRNKKELEDHLAFLQEAEKRDHRKIGPAMKLFHIQEEAPGSVFWHPLGWELFQTIVRYLRKRNHEALYSEINTPDILERRFWETSGHWEKYSANMFLTKTPDQKSFALKPMSCPGAVQIFNTGTKSYRDLPLRVSEFGKVHRYEPSGALHGTMRIRSFTQDDAHIFCTEEQIQDECIKICLLIFKIYKDFGFKNITIKLSTRPHQRIGSDETWDKAEHALAEALKKLDIPYEILPHEGAFYGPKLEFTLKDSLKRSWQCGTVQLDFNLPLRLQAFFTDTDGKKKNPIMIHHALLGSIERFIGILIEHYEGNLPLWLAPRKIVICNITSEVVDYAEEIYTLFKNQGIDISLDLRNEKLNYKIREHSVSKVPIIGIVGKNEKEKRTISLRYLGSFQEKTLELDTFVSQMKKDIEVFL